MAGAPSTVGSSTPTDDAELVPELVLHGVVRLEVRADGSRLRLAEGTLTLANKTGLLTHKATATCAPNQHHWAVALDDGTLTCWWVHTCVELAFKRRPPSSDPVVILVLPQHTAPMRAAAQQLAEALGISLTRPDLEPGDADSLPPRAALFAAAVILRSGSLAARGLHGAAQLITSGFDAALESFRRNVAPTPLAQSPPRMRRESNLARVEQVLESASTVARAAEGVTSRMGEGISIVATGAGNAAAGVLVPSVGTKGSRIGVVARTVGGATLAAAREVIDALGDCSSTVIASGAVVASSAVTHKYGSDAGRAASTAMSAVGSTTAAAVNISLLGRRSLAKSVAKGAAQGAVKGWVERTSPPPSPVPRSSSRSSSASNLSKLDRGPSLEHNLQDGIELGDGVTLHAPVGGLGGIEQPPRIHSPPPPLDLPLDREATEAPLDHEEPLHL